jgi:hypothetical protein
MSLRLPHRLSMVLHVIGTKWQLCVLIEVMLLRADLSQPLHRGIRPLYHVLRDEPLHGSMPEFAASSQLDERK